MPRPRHPGRRLDRREFLGALSTGAILSCSEHGVVRADICIYGGTSGGVVAALQAARLGRQVVIVDPGRHLGGMTSGGLSAIDIGNPKTVGGITREYFTELAALYGRELPWDREIKGVATGGSFTVEPHGAEALFQHMVDKAGIAVLFAQPIAQAIKRGAEIEEIVSAGGLRVQASIFIDATYEGDLMAKAGVSHTLAREGNDEHGETLNGVMFHPRYAPATDWGIAGPNGRRPDGKGLWDRDIPLDPYAVEGDPSSGPAPLIHAEPAGPPGSAAPGVQAYCYRLCLTKDPDNKIPIGRPDGYDRRMYELVARFIRECVAAGDDMDLRWFSKHDPIPNGKFDFNTATFGGNLPQAGWGWSEADPATRASIGKEHESYHRGLLHFLATDNVVPERVRSEMGSFGLCKDEFPDTDGWPHQIYVREGRRMVSDLILTQHHSQGHEIAPQAIGLGSYSIDLHEIRRVIHNGMVWREGKGGGRVPHPYPIGYGAITPKASQARNLFVTFAISATHVAFGSTRMEPPFMILSQSAATAADMAIEDRVGVQDVDYGRLADRLRSDGQIIEWEVGQS